MPATTSNRVKRQAVSYVASLMLVFALMALPAVQVRAQTQAGDVAAIKGAATAEAGDAKRGLAQGVAVFVDETIATDPNSRLTLSLGKSTTIRLGERARVRIDRHLVNAGGAFDLSSGAILFDRGAGAPKGDTSVRSPYGLLAVRGTRFFAGPSNGVFGVFVEHGQVDVTGGGKTVTLTAGLGTNIKSPGNAPTRPAVWKVARIKAAMESVQ